MRNPDRNLLSAKQNEILEKFDVYCALVANVRRVQSLNRLSAFERDAWQHSFDSYWVKTVHEIRPAMAAYVTTFWPTFLGRPKH